MTGFGVRIANSTAAVRLVAVAVLLAGAALIGMGPSGKVGAAVATAPELTSPVSGSTLTSFGPTLTWSNPGGATQYHLQVTPANNDGPGVDVHIGQVGTSFAVPAPPLWYGLLPDMTYTWRVRVSDATTFVGLTDGSWSPWAEATFRTPKVTSTTISPLTPANGDTVTTKTPGLMFRNTASGVFYYQLQLSKDPTFNDDPATATAMIYSALIHSGVSVPRSTYAVPSSAPLEDKTTYYWRVRPRVQGDGTPATWSALYSFKTDTSAAGALTVSGASIGSEATPTGTCAAGKAAATFASSPEFTRLYYALPYTGAAATVRIWYRDGVPITATSVDLKADSTCFTSSTSLYLGFPIFPGVHKLEIWHGGRVIRTGTTTVTAATTFQAGPVSVGTGPSTTSACGVAGEATTFPSGTTRLSVRWTTVGAADYKVRVFKGTATTPTTEGPLTAQGPVGCEGGVLTFSNGAWRIDVTDNANKVLRTASITIG